MDEKKLIIVNCDYQFRDIVICALRYAIGRNTYIVDEICDWVESHPEIIDNRMCGVMMRDVEEQLTYYDRNGVNSITEIDYKRLKEFRDWLSTYFIKNI